MLFETLPPEMEAIQVPRIILQPIIENAFLHSLENMEENGLLAITFECDEAHAYIHVEDNGQGLTNRERQILADKMENPVIETTGIINTHRRLRLKFGEGCGIMVQEGSNGGTRVTLILKRSL